MPIYVDFHHVTELSIPDIKRFLRLAEREACDEFGVRPLELFFGDNGRVFCVHAAPNEVAVRRRHRGLGLPCRAVHEVATLPRGHVPRDYEKALVQQAVLREEAELDAVDEASYGWLQPVG
jgi:hypothetical protein